MWLRAAGGVLAAAAGVCISCTKVGPEYKRPELDVPATYRATTLPDTGHLATNWWVLFKDEDLTKLEESAIAANPDLRAAMERVAQARAAARVVQSQFYPTVTLDPSVTW